MSACNYEPGANCDFYDEVICAYEVNCNTDICAGDTEILNPNNSCECILDIIQVLGCMDPLAENFNPAANCEDGTCVIVSSQFHVEESELELYPNPVQSVLQVYSNEAQMSVVGIYTLKGRLIKSYSSQEISSVQMLNVSELSPGKYFVVVVSDGKSLVLPFIKM